MGRAIQGLGAGGQLGLVNVTISDLIAVRYGILISCYPPFPFFSFFFFFLRKGGFTHETPFRERGVYLGYVGLTWAFASAIGPVLGGVFTEKVTWRLCFWINLPIGIVAILGLVVFLHLESPKVTVSEGLKRVDWLGKRPKAFVKRW